MAPLMPKNLEPEISHFDKLMTDQAAKSFLQAFPPAESVINQCACCSTLHNADAEAAVDKYKHIIEMRIQEVQKLLQERQRSSGVQTTRLDLENILNLKLSLNGGGPLGGRRTFVGEGPGVLTNEFIVSVGRNIRQSREARIAVLEKRLSTIRAMIAREEREQRKQQKQYDQRELRELHKQGKQRAEQQQERQTQPLVLAKQVKTGTSKDGELASMRSKERMELAKGEFLEVLLSLCRRDKKGAYKADVVEDVFGAGREVRRGCGLKRVW